MKRFLLFPFMFLLVFSVTACDKDSDKTDDTEQNGNENNDGDDNNDGENPTGNGKYLVLFASRSGNTESMAEAIGKTLNCDVVEIVPTVAYDEDYNLMLARAQREQSAISQGNYPAINTTVENLEDYDVVFIGYPIWYGHMATPMQTFLHNQGSQLAGKHIALFASSGSSGISTSVTEARALSPNATFTETLLLTSGSLGQMESRINAWLRQINILAE
ncbi:flavodoxin, partial [Prevotella sp. 10(H)]|uniref:flavodoxin n=1 Tax=Prevotella sp. 10(H) TaxID=1158294 RepID=UPI0004A7205D